MLKKSPSSPKRKTALRHKVVGMTRDGVAILEQKTKPTHFTSRQIKATIAALRKEWSKSVPQKETGD